VHPRGRTPEIQLPGNRHETLQLPELKRDPAIVSIDPKDD
jgi:hypothetical protein